jgi:protein-tyrosine phosphatase
MHEESLAPAGVTRQIFQTFQSFARIVDVDIRTAVGAWRRRRGGVEITFAIGLAYFQTRSLRRVASQPSVVYWDRGQVSSESAILIDLHSHLLPGIDDGAANLLVSLAMARMAVAGGVTVQACTPHIMPGVYDNTGPQIRRAVAALQEELDQEGIPLKLVVGADVHIAPDMIARLKSGHLLSLADSRYLLVEPPHHVAPARLDEMLFAMMVAGYQPILTHPERLGWVRPRYDLIKQLVDHGVWMQITASSLIGAFGREPKYWAERMLGEGLVHIMASDSHDARRRPPNLIKGFERAVASIGEREATHLVTTRPMNILANHAPGNSTAVVATGVGLEIIDDSRADVAQLRSRPVIEALGSDINSGDGGWIGRLRQFVGRNH